MEIEVYVQKKRILVCSILLAGIGCASIAQRDYACKSGMERVSFLAWPYFLFGVTTQQTDCALIEPLKFEMGEYYAANKVPIDYEIRFAEGQLTETVALDNFARVYNCEGDGIRKFRQLLQTNRLEIFSADSDASARKVMLKIENLIKQDESFKGLCSP